MNRANKPGKLMAVENISPTAKAKLIPSMFRWEEEIVLPPCSKEK